MSLSKNMAVMKALTEDCLRRFKVAPHTTQDDVEIAFKVLKLIIRHNSVYVFADTERVFKGFADTFDRPCTQLLSLSMIDQIQEGTVIFLHSGVRTEEQRALYHHYVDRLKQRLEIDVFHIGRWAGNGI